MRFRLLLPFVCAASLLAQAPSTTQTGKADAAMQRAQQFRIPGGVAISPDGLNLAYTLRGREGTTLHLVPMPKGDTATVDQSKDKLIAPSDATNCSNSSPVWSPDSTTLAFTSSCTSKEEKPGQEQIFLFTTADGKTRELTHVTGNIQHAAWSPDGKKIAFLFVENATRTAGALDAMKPFAGVIGEDNVEVQRVYEVDSTDGKGTWVSPKDLHVYEFAWSPNSEHIALIGAPAPGENNWWVAKLIRVDSMGKEGWALDTTVLFDPATTKTAMHGLQIAVPTWSPDGKKIAFIGGLMSDQGSTGGDVWVVDAKPGAEPVDITPNIDGTPTFEAWVGDHQVGFVEDRRGKILLPDYDINTKALIPGSATDLGMVSVGGGPIKNAISFTDKGEFAFTESSFNQAPEIWGGAADHIHQLTHFNDGLPVPSTKVESVEWENEGFHVQGWLTYPKDYDPKKHYPIIVNVHGGPSASAGPRGSGIFSNLGYFEFNPNPRGSFGQGEAFTQANRKDFGYGDLRDIEKGLDTLEARIPAIDKNREGITGWSYGGFMTMFAVTQTHRFRAAVAGAGLSDWLSYYGENSIDQWMIPFFGASVYDDPAVYAKSSAITFIKNVTTPTLVIVGDRDGECPAPQSFEFWHALRDLGVKTQLVVYPNEGHGFRDPAHIKDRTEREVRWFAENMK